MIGNVMDYCRNHFIDEVESGYYEFDVDNSKIVGTFTADNYMVGGYIYVYGSKMNDNAYLITSVSATELEVDTAPSVAEDTTDKYTVHIVSCAIPRAFISLVSDVTTWETANGSMAGIASETIGKFSTTYGDAVKAGGGWQGAFGNRLKEYRKLYNDLQCFGVYYGSY